VLAYDDDDDDDGELQSKTCGRARFICEISLPQHARLVCALWNQEEIVFYCRLMMLLEKCDW
jgi:hypothetical protein